MRALIALTLVACGPAHPTTPDNARLDVHIEWAQGQHFEIRTTNDLVAGPVGMREVAFGDLEVVSVADGVAELRYSLRELHRDRPVSPIVIAPTVDHPSIVITYHLDSHGTLVGQPRLEDASERTDEQGNEWTLSLLFAEPVLPHEPVRAGDRWTVPTTFAPEWVPARRREDTHRSLQLASVEAATPPATGRVAHIELDWDPVFRLPQIEPEVRAHVEGRVRIALAAPLRWYSLRSLELYAPGTRRGSGAVPARRVQHELCVALEGTELDCTPSGPPFPGNIEPDRPRATVYEGEACTARVAHMRERIAAAQSTLRFDIEPDAVLPASPRGHAIAQPGMLIELSGGAWHSGTAVLMTPAALGERVDTFLREQALELPSGSRLQIYVVAADGESLTPLRAAWTALHSRGDVVLLVAPSGEDVGMDADAPPYVRARWEHASASEDPTERMRRVNELASQAVATCAGVAGVFASMIHASNAERASALATDLPHAIEGCGCGGLDVDLLDAYATRVMTLGGARAFGVPLTEATVTRMRPGTTVRALLDGLH